MAYEMPLDFAPGDQWKYSNTGYVLLGAIVRKASGKFYGDVLRERVFTPLGMTTARVISEADIVPHRAAGYRLRDGELKNQEWVSPALNTTADGSLYLSLRDLHRLGSRAARAGGPEAGELERDLRAGPAEQRPPSSLRLRMGRRPLAGQHGRSSTAAPGRDSRPTSRATWATISRSSCSPTSRRRSPSASSTRSRRTSFPKLTADRRRGRSSAPRSPTAAAAPLRRADVRIEGDTIREVGAITPRPDDRVIDATGLVLAPGFIDAHNHSTDGLDSDPEAITQVSQGITTVLLGQDGSSPCPLRDYLASAARRPRR